MIGRKFGNPFARLQESIEKNPLGADRKKKDLQELYAHNQNPRLNSLTSIELSRSQKFTPKKEDQETLKSDLLQLKAIAYSQVTDISLADSIKKFRPSNHCKRNDKQIFNKRNRIPYDIYQLKICATYDQHKSDKTIQVSPSTFGHRPSSASRIFGPIFQKKSSVQKEKQKDKNCRNEFELCTGSGMRFQLLHYLLNEESVCINQAKKRELAYKSVTKDSNSLLQEDEDIDMKLWNVNETLYKIRDDQKTIKWDTSSIFANKSKHLSQHVSTPTDFSCNDKKQTKPSRRSKECSIPKWKEEMNRLCMQKVSFAGNELKYSGKQVSCALRKQFEHEKILEKREEYHKKLVEQEKVKRIADRRTLITQWDRIKQHKN